jgi:hypothetical protein
MSQVFDFEQEPMTNSSKPKRYQMFFSASKGIYNI